MRNRKFDRAFAVGVVLVTIVALLAVVFFAINNPFIERHVCIVIREGWYREDHTAPAGGGVGASTLLKNTVTGNQEWLWCETEGGCGLRVGDRVEISFVFGNFLSWRKLPESTSTDNQDA